MDASALKLELVCISEKGVGIKRKILTPKRFYTRLFLA